MDIKKKTSSLLIGSMLFGLFFGAGNLIFPVHLGQETGSNVFLATLGFLLSGSGIPFLAVVAIGLTGSRDMLDLGRRVHKGYGYFVTILLYLTIGPFFALPRTATVPFQVGIALNIPEAYQRIGLLIFTILFFGIALLFSLKPAKIMNLIGKFLNPLFLGFLGVLFLIAYLNPMGNSAAIAPAVTYSVPFMKGFIEGYQTMDMLAGLAFGSIVIASIKQLGITDPRDIAKETIKSGSVAVVLMCLIYAGLAWLGSTSANIFPVSANGGIALAEISLYYLGSFGSIFLSITITLACLKTAIGLITACANTFVTMFPNSLGYKTYAVLFSIFSCGVANVGLTQLLKLSMPMLMFLSPLAITLILLGLFENFFQKSRIVYLSVTVATLLISVGDALNAMPDSIRQSGVGTSILSVYHRIPFFDVGMGWIIPAVIGLLVGLAIAKTTNKSSLKGGS